MTSPTTPAVPAGWYPDPAGSGRSRWWDGTQWTDHFQDPYTAASPSTTLRAPDGTAPYTPWIWAILGVMALLILPVLFLDYDAVVEEALRPTSTLSTTPAELISGALGWIGIALYVVFAYLDVKALRARGVPQPFHWAWMFFAFVTPLVYVIGRSVVVHRRTGSGLAPIWIAVALTVTTWVVTIAVIVPVIAGIFDAVMSDPTLYR